MKYKEYFDYYLELEKDFFDTESYVAFEEENYKTYSIKYLKLYLSICSEIDCIMKEICRSICTSTTANTIKQYYPIITNKFINFKEESVYYKKQKIELYPWKKWEKDASPNWWKYYNKIKHQRLELDNNTNNKYYKYANLENVLNALAALYIAEQYYMYSYDYLKEAVIPQELKGSFLTKEEVADCEKSDSMYRYTSKRCSMKRWEDNNCYITTYVDSYTDLEGLDYIVYYE